MTDRRHRQRGGSSLIEFTIVGIPIIFVLFSTFEMSRGMWIYHTLAYAARAGTRYAVVHGVNCSLNGNTYCVNIPQLAAVLRDASVGLDPKQMTVTLTPSQGSATSDTLDNLLNSGTYSTTIWPPSSPQGTNGIGQPVQISIVYPFSSGICMVWPGTKVSGAPGTIYLPASSNALIQF